MNTHSDSLPLYQRKEKLENEFNQVLSFVFIDSVTLQNACYYGFFYPLNLDPTSSDYSFIAYPPIIKIQQSVIKAITSNFLFERKTFTGDKGIKENYVLKVYFRSETQRYVCIFSVVTLFAHFKYI